MQAEHLQGGSMYADVVLARDSAQIADHRPSGDSGQQLTLPLKLPGFAVVWLTMIVSASASSRHLHGAVQHGDQFSPVEAIEEGNEEERKELRGASACP